MVGEGGIWGGNANGEGLRLAVMNEGETVTRSSGQKRLKDLVFVEALTSSSTRPAPGPNGDGMATLRSASAVV